MKRFALYFGVVWLGGVALVLAAAVLKLAWQDCPLCVTIGVITLLAIAGLFWNALPMGASSSAPPPPMGYQPRSGPVAPRPPAGAGTARRGN